MPRKPKKPPPKDRRVQIVISDADLAALDEWRARNQAWSRSEAIRRAIRRMVGGKDGGDE